MKVIFRTIEAAAEFVRRTQLPAYFYNTVISPQTPVSVRMSDGREYKLAYIQIINDNLEFICEDKPL